MHPTGGEGWGAKGVKGGWQGAGKMCLRVGKKRLPPLVAPMIPNLTFLTCPVKHDLLKKIAQTLKINKKCNFSLFFLTSVSFRSVLYYQSSQVSKFPY